MQFQSDFHESTGSPAGGETENRPNDLRAVRGTRENREYLLLVFATRLQDTMELRHFFVGMSKAPVFALVIGLIGCLEGLRVEGTAQSVGERTTSSVVQTISLVLSLDALAALWFMPMDL